MEIGSLADWVSSGATLVAILVVFWQVSSDRRNDKKNKEIEFLLTKHDNIYNETRNLSDYVLKILGDTPHSHSITVKEGNAQYVKMMSSLNTLLVEEELIQFLSTKNQIKYKETYKDIVLKIRKNCEEHYAFFEFMNIEEELIIEKISEPFYENLLNLSENTTNLIMLYTSNLKNIYYK